MLFRKNIERNEEPIIEHNNFHNIQQQNKEFEAMANEDVSIISSNVTIEGKLISSGNVRIDGKIEGDVIVHGNLTLGETSVINGEVKAENITIGGKVVGYVNANDKLILESKSYLEGDITANVLVIEAGAKFNGKSNMVPPTERKDNNIKKEEAPQISAFSGFQVASNLDDEQ
ncbi:MAG TPA: polymer-forming cytoskeletal protein [Ignavibacteriales bacterium]|nr:polymer-forming cytoskeletal protein [Ignavibacteriales bacterium]HOL80991.1 polymer-forming cytoskeletal protein [Ignavibacteriales bacterium]HOM64727.1 polymer-forming cytoskeletal protein [Ignavibacteriales bacterium]HPD66741.1 polymer-forming cytoskeletal protein [Ignavibacteriales bacterium]HPP32771.1 polymer-forming cytoskeletal protein [Ignavibacteriales bacterium]